MYTVYGCSLSSRYICFYVWLNICIRFKNIRTPLSYSCVKGIFKKSTTTLLNNMNPFFPLTHFTLYICIIVVDRSELPTKFYRVSGGGSFLNFEDKNSIICCKLYKRSFQLYSMMALERSINQSFGSGHGAGRSGK